MDGDRKLTPAALMAKADGRTHSGLISAFGRHLVVSALVSRDLGRALNRAHEIRQIADYREESVAPADAKELVEQAESFVAAIRDEFMPREGSGSVDAPGRRG